MNKKMILFALSGMLCLIISSCGGGSGGSSGSGAVSASVSESSGSINLSGKVWRDQNQDKIINANETGIPSIKVNLFRDSNGNNTLDSTDELITTTNADWDGNYSFNVTNTTGTYFISIDIQSGINGLLLTTESADTITSPSFVALRINVTNLDAVITALNFGFVNLAKWKADISSNGTGFPFGSPFISSPAIAPDGTIYIGSTNHFLYAFFPNGTLKWKYEVGDKIVASPAIGSDGTIYVGSADRQFYAINPDGSLKWVFATKSILSSSAAIATDGTIYVGGTHLDLTIICVGSDKQTTVQLGELYAINPNGTLKWSFPLSGVVNSSPAVASDGTIYIGSDGDFKFDISNPCGIKFSPAVPSTYPPSDANPFFPVNGHVYAVNANGTLKWDFKTLGHVESSPAIGDDGTIYIGSHYPLEAYGATRSDLVGVGSLTTGYLYAINPKGTIKWYTDLFGAVDSSPSIASDGTIYVGSDKNDFFAVDPSGTIKWQYPTRGDVKSSPAIASDGTIYVGSNDGSLYAINPDGTVKSRFILSEGSVNSSPNIGLDGTLYFATENDVHALIVSSPLAEAPWPKFRRDLVNTGRK